MSEEERLSETPVEGQWFPEMSWSTRIQGFVLFSVLGFFASALSWFALSTGAYWKYAVLMTLGNTMSICSTMLLMGPQKQLRSMFDETRRQSTFVYLGTMVGTVIIAVLFKSSFLCALCCMAQYGAFVWYSLSYIPYGREALVACLTSTTRVVTSV